MDALEPQAKAWATPNTRDSEDSARHTTDPSRPMHPGTTLTDGIRKWATPTSRDHKDGTQDGSRCRKGINSILGRQAPAMKPPGPASSPSGPTSRRLWATPRAQENDQGEATKEAVRESSDWLGANRGATLQTHASALTGKRRLNPRFVEWLMGLPVGWTDLGP
jgi:hypothetical protein